MYKNLVIVESPAKAKTIEKFLGEDYKVMSSYGHIRDLKKKVFSIDIEDNYRPIYEIPADKQKLVDTLRSEAAKAETVWLASDEDREGEAIAWHLAEVLHLDPTKTKRIVFHEITKKAILEAIANPRTIDLARVDAQQARRVLDRIVGFELSPVLWKKVKPALSAGRVQSVAVRLIVEREREIEQFNSEASYRIVAEFVTPDKETSFKAELNHRFKTQEEVNDFLASCAKATFTIEDINVRPAHKTPAPPFTTSTLQQEAARKLGFSVAQTMSVAQHLYENGHITYMRTDSVNLSSLCINTTREEILSTLGDKYLHIRKYPNKSKGAQEAHEAIRPTFISNHSIEGNRQEQRLYELIWKRTIASQMSDAEIERTTVNIAISGRNEVFVASGEVLKFDGFLRVYLESNDEENENEDTSILPVMKIGQQPTYNNIVATERYTQHPPRYTEASLVRKLEELGIGRPSTYAPTISTIQQREYVVKGDRQGTTRQCNVITLHDNTITLGNNIENTGAEKGKLLPTDVGIVVNDFLTEYFPNILNYNFTASIEERFDDIAEGKVEWESVIDKFYTDFHPTITAANALRLEHKVGERILGNDPQSGRVVSVKIGRYGPIVQIGQPGDSEKPVFASLMKNQTINTITLDEALKLFDLPRIVGQYEGNTIEANVGKFGPYIRHNNKFVSIPKTLTPQSITLEEAIELIEQKRQEDSNRLIKRYDEDAELEILNGRYGAYIAYKKKNYKIPKGTDAATLSYTDCMRIVEDADKNSTTTKRISRKTTTKKK
ncbi:MAG: type I DNA topoisomerase [Bacteroidaceae bacterium]|nr:type I DNA topoisomerase [Bacteroidaceae bacterium]